MEVGDTFVIGMRNLTKPMIYFNNSENATVKNVTIYTSPAGGINSANSSGMTFKNVQIRIKPDSGRLRSTNADGMHIRNNREGAVIMDSYFEASGDDFINMYYSPHTIQQVISDTQFQMTDNSPRPKPGDTLQVFDPIEGVIKGEALVAEVTAVLDLYEVTLASPIAGMKAGPDHETADQVFNLNAASEDFVVKNNTFKNGRRHGLLLKVSGGVIEGNTFVNNHGAAIAIHNEPDWPEGPMSRNVIIKNNVMTDNLHIGRIEKSHDAVLEIAGKRLGNDIAETKGMQNITMIGNKITGALLHGISVAGGQNIVLKDNTIKTDAASAPSPIYEQAVNGRIIRELTPSPVFIKHAEQIEIKDLKVEDLRQDLGAAIMTSGSVQQLEVRGSTLSLAPGVAEIANVDE